MKLKDIKVLYSIVCFITLISLSKCIASQCYDIINYGYVTTTWNSNQMTCCMLKTQIIKNCQLYQSLITTSSYDLVTSQQVQCITKPPSTFLAALAQGGYAYVPYSQRINYCAKYHSTDDSFTTFTCTQCQIFYRLNGYGRCTDVIDNCVTYQKLGSCIQCGDGYQVIGGTCVPLILQSSDPNCNLSNRDDGNCIKCKQNYTLAGAVCYDSIKDKKTIDLLLGSCKQTQIRTSLGNCITMMLHCGKYDQVSGVCLYCETGFMFNDSLTECVATREYNATNMCGKSSSQSTTLKYINGKCNEVDINCVDNPPVQTGCVNCADGYFSWSGKCYFINAQQNN